MDMNLLTIKLIYLGFVVVTIVIRWPYNKANKNNKIAKDQKSPLEKGLLTLATIGMVLLPISHTFSPIWHFANYNTPLWAQATGIALIAPTAWLFYRSHKDLGVNWSPTLEVRENHTLVTRGVYQSIRHPMYTSIWLWVLVQGLLLSNFIAGWSGLVAFGLLYALRVKHEEKMMINQFGQQYQDYMVNTNRLLPKLR